MPDPTPGETAWMAYQTRLHALTQALPLDYPRPFATLAAVQRAAWEAAAQAVLVQWWQQHEAIICGDTEEDNGDADRPAT